MTAARKTKRPPWFFLLFAAHGRAIRASINHLSFAPVSTFLTFAVIGITLALPFGLFVLLQNIQIVTSGLHNSAQISLYLKKNISNSQIIDLQNELRLDKDIIRTTYISPEEGLKEFQKETNLGHALENLSDNPLPGVLIIEPRETLHDIKSIQALVDRLNHFSNVDQAELDLLWLQRLNMILLIANRLLYGVTLLFAIAVILIIGNTIRLITQNHRDEILVTKLLGGSDSFIRRPFLYSGIIYGLSGGIIAWLLIDLALWALLQGPINHLAVLYQTSFQLKGLDLRTTLHLLLGSALLGFIGSWLAVGRHLFSMDPR